MDKLRQDVLARLPKASKLVVSHKEVKIPIQRSKNAVANQKKVQMKGPFSEPLTGWVENLPNSRQISSPGERANLQKRGLS